MNIKQILFEATYPDISDKISSIFEKFKKNKSINVSEYFGKNIIIMKGDANTTEFVKDGAVIITIETKNRNKEEIKDSIYHELIHAFDFSRGKSLKNKEKRYDKNIGYLRDIYEFNQMINQIIHASLKNKDIKKDLMELKGTEDMKNFFDNWFDDEFKKYLDNDLLKKFLIRLKRETMEKS